MVVLPSADADTRYEQGYDRLLLLTTLKDGWHDGDGRSIDPTALEMARDATEALMEHYPDMRLYAYPMPNGGVQLEWDDGSTEWSMEFHADLTIDLHLLDTKTGQDRLETFDNFREAIAQVRDDERQRVSQYRATETRTGWCEVSHDLQAWYFRHPTPRMLMLPDTSSNGPAIGLGGEDPEHPSLECQ